MPTMRKVAQKMHRFFQENYQYISSITIVVTILIGFLHFQFSQYNRDLIYWKELFEFCYNELEHFALILVMVVVLIKVIFLAFIIGINTRSIHWLDELSQIELKKRYADFLFIRLIADIDKVEEKYLRNYKSNELVPVKNFILAHQDIRRTIENFRKDARKLLTPNEIEVSLPVEEVYGLLEEEERALRRTRFYNMDITADDDLIKSLVNPQ